MSKVIVERPRRGGAGPRKPGRTRALVDDDGAPLRASMRAPQKRPEKTKYLNENLAPLRRFLEKQTGRPWNKVYAEIAENLKPTSTVQQHVRDHVEDFVAVNTRMRAGAVYVTGRWGREQALSEAWQHLYVHPRTGLLRKNEHYKRWSAKRRGEQERIDAERAKRMREISPTTQLHLFGDIWFEVTLAKMKVRARTDREGRPYNVTAPYTDVVLNAKFSELPAEELYAKSGVYAAAKRQLSKADLKRYGLK